MIVVLLIETFGTQSSVDTNDTLTPGVIKPTKIVLFNDTKKDLPTPIVEEPATNCRLHGSVYCCFDFALHAVDNTLVVGDLWDLPIRIKGSFKLKKKICF